MSTKHRRFIDSFEDPAVEPTITEYPESINPSRITKFMCLKVATMIFVPIIDDHISHEDCYCNICCKWMKISGSWILS